MKNPPEPTLQRVSITKDGGNCDDEDPNNSHCLIVGQEDTDGTNNLPLSTSPPLSAVRSLNVGGKLRSVGHSRESSGASNLSVRFSKIGDECEDFEGGWSKRCTAEIVSNHLNSGEVTTKVPLTLTARRLKRTRPTSKSLIRSGASSGVDEDGDEDLTLSERLSQDGDEHEVVDDITDNEEELHQDDIEHCRSATKCRLLPRLNTDEDHSSSAFETGRRAPGYFRMQQGDSKSQNSDYGSFCNTPVGGETVSAAPPGDSSGNFKQNSSINKLSSSVMSCSVATSGYQRVPAGDEECANFVDSVEMSKNNESSSPSQRLQLIEERTSSGVAGADSYDSSSLSEDDVGGANARSGYTRRKTRHRDRGSEITRIEMPSDDGPSLGDHGGLMESMSPPPEYCKTFLAFIFLLFSWLATVTSLSLTHERVPDYDTLPDIYLDNVTYQEWSLDACEIILIAATWVAFTVVIFHKHRSVVFRRLFLLVGIHYYYRAITMYVTVLPKPNKEYLCAPKLDHVSPLIIIQRVIRLFSGLGLSINGHQVYCGDYIYSGHTMTLVTAYLAVKEYSPRRWLVLHYFMLLITILGVVLLLLGHGHYTIDVVIAYWVTTRVWWIYHTLANNQSLKDAGKSTSHQQTNYLANIWWWWLFKYFERNVPVGLPRVYDWPVPNKLVDCCSYVLGRIKSTSSSDDEHVENVGYARFWCCCLPTRSNSDQAETGEATAVLESP